MFDFSSDRAGLDAMVCLRERHFTPTASA